MRCPPSPSAACRSTAAGASGSTTGSSRRSTSRGEAAGEQLLDVRRDPGVVVDPAERYRCPKCTDDVVHAPFRDPLLDSERVESAEELARAQKFAHAFRFICPSW
jgi:hypothetical protein